MRQSHRKLQLLMQLPQLQKLQQPPAVRKLKPHLAVRKLPQLQAPRKPQQLQLQMQQATLILLLLQTGAGACLHLGQLPEAVGLFLPRRRHVTAAAAPALLRGRPLGEGEMEEPPHDSQ